MNFYLDTQYCLIVNNRHMQVIKPTIRQAPLQEDKESTLMNRSRYFETTLTVLSA